jgi:uncharacterized RmlC-like cupin family protein
MIISGRYTMNAETEPAVAVVRSGRTERSDQGLPTFVGISDRTAGAQAISMRLIVVPPGGAAEPHSHVGFETAIYMIKGRVETRYGPGLRQAVITEMGDFLFIPAGVPHQPVNLSASEEAIAVACRDDPRQHEDVEPYDPDGA